MSHLASCVASIVLGYFSMMMAFGNNIHRKCLDLIENYKYNGNEMTILNDITEIMCSYSNTKELSF